MGYTHYWTYNPDKIENTELLRRKFKSASKEIKNFAKFCEVQELCKVRGGFGEGKPVFNETEIWFNGDGKENLDHETFSIHWIRQNRGDNWNFCKTAHKPYDILVCFSLLALAERFDKSVFSFSSDGTMEDEEWQKAVQLYDAFTGRDGKKLIETNWEK